MTGNMSGFESYINRSEVLFSAAASANFPTISKRNAELQVTIDITGSVIVIGTKKAFFKK